MMRNCWSIFDVLTPISIKREKCLEVGLKPVEMYYPEMEIADGPFILSKDTTADLLTEEFIQLTQNNVLVTF